MSRRLSLVLCASLALGLAGPVEAQQLREPVEGQLRQAPLAGALQFAQVIYLVGALFQGIAYQPFVLMLLGVQMGLWSYCKRTDSQAKKARRERRQAEVDAGRHLLVAGLRGGDIDLFARKPCRHSFIGVTHAGTPIRKALNNASPRKGFHTMCAANLVKV